MLSHTTNQLWIDESRAIMAQKGISWKRLYREYNFVYFPWNCEYNTSRMYFSLRIQIRPLMIFQPICVQEIESILDYVTEKNLTTVVCNGRHSTQLISPEVLIDMSRMNAVKIKEKQGKEILVAEAGCTQGQLNEFLFVKEKRNCYSHFGHFIHAFGGGSASTVGSAGIATVGGIGTLRRKYGLTVDSVIKYVITLPPTSTTKAQTVIASSSEYPDLYWALRGGGGNNFGIVSKIYYKILNVPPVIQYTVTWPWSQAATVLTLWQQTSPSRPPNFNEDMGIFSEIIDQVQTPGISLVGIYVTTGFENYDLRIRQELAPLINLGGTLSIEIPIDYSNLYEKLVQQRVYHNFSMIQGLFLKQFDVNQVIDYINNAPPSGNVSIGFQLLGGKISDIDPTSTAFFFRNYNFFIDIASNCEKLIDLSGIEQWTETTTSELLHSDSILIVGAYLGFPITFSDISISPSIYNKINYPRLQELQQKYNPLKILVPSL